MEKQPGLVPRLARRVGLVPAGRIGELSDALTRAEQRSSELKRELDAAKEEARTLKGKVRELRERLEQARQIQPNTDVTVSAANAANAANAAHAEQVAKLNQKAERELQRLRERESEQAGKLDDALKRMHSANHTVRLGREHLMMIEVKLDIVEGAIKVLDQRTRAALAAAQQHADAEREPVQSR